MKIKNLVNGDDLAQVYETSRLARKEADVVMVNLYDKTLAWTDVGATVDVKPYLDDWGCAGASCPPRWPTGRTTRAGSGPFPTSPPTGPSPTTAPCSTGPGSTRSPPRGTS